MSQCKKRASSSFEQLEGRTLLSTTPAVMGFLVDYQIGNQNNTVFSEDNTNKVANDNLDWADLTQVNYFALLPNATPAFKNNPAGARTATSDGGIQALTDSGFDPSAQLPALVTDAHSHNVKVFVTVGAGDANADYDMDALMNSPSAWSAFATNIKNFVDQYHLDGVDLDYEPTGQANFTVTQTQLENFGKLIKTIKVAYPSLTLTADPMGGPVELSDSNGVSTGTSVHMLDSVAVANLDQINVQAYPVASKDEADGIMDDWASYISGGKDFNNLTVTADVSKLHYGLDIAPDDTSNNPAGVIEAKVDKTISDGFGGLFIFELDADTGNTSIVQRIGSEIEKDTGTPQTGGSVSGTVKQSNGTGISGITVYLDANDDKMIDNGELSTMSGADGTYSFSDVPVGAYIVRQQLPAGTTQKTPTNGSGNHVTVTDGADLSGENFVDSIAGAGGSVSGTVKDTHGTGLGNVTVYLDGNNNRTLDTGELSTTTTSDGSYAFTGVPAGAYIVRQDLPSGVTQKTPTKGNGNHVTVKDDGNLTKQNFVDTVAGAGGSVSGTVKDSHGAGIPSITVYLDANDNRTLDTGELSTTTSSNGSYAFTGVPAGVYIVRQDLPSSVTQKTPTKGNGNHITVTDDSNLTKRNFVDKSAFGAVSGKVRLSDKKGIAGITVYLDANDSHTHDNGERSTVTDNDGEYELSDVLPGTYIVRQELPPKQFLQISPKNNTGNHITLKACDNLTGRNFVDEQL